MGDSSDFVVGTAVVLVSEMSQEVCLSHYVESNQLLQQIHYQCTHNLQQICFGVRR